MSMVRSELSFHDKWNVEALYSTPLTWESEFQQLKGAENAPRWPALASFKGKLKRPDAAVALFALYFELDRKLSKLYTYAHLRHDENLGDDAFKSGFGLISSLQYDFQLESSWIEPELLTLNEVDFQHLEISMKF